MKIAVIGSGAMGMLFGGYLSKENEVLLIDTDKTKVDKINKDGIRIQEADGRITTAAPKATFCSEGLRNIDLVIVFVKSMYSRTALEINRGLIGPETYVMSLQNGSGHDSVLGDFAALNRIILGTTQHNSSILEPGAIHHGGGGKTYIGLIQGSGDELKPIRDTFSRCGFETKISSVIQKHIWEKLFVNATASALTAILQTKLGFLIESEHAWNLTAQLIEEAVAVANGDAMGFDEDEITRNVRMLLEGARDGYTSIYADIRDGRKTEVDTITGAVITAGKRNHIPAPTHEFVAQLIHALEDKNGSRADPAKEKR